MKKNALWIILVLAVIAFIAVYTMQQEDGLKIGNTTIIRSGADQNVGEELAQDADNLAEEVEDVIQGIIDEVEQEIEDGQEVVSDAVNEAGVAIEDGQEVVSDAVDEAGEAIEDATDNDGTTEVVVVNDGYVEYTPEIVETALADDKKVILFFHATRCPSCMALDEDVKENIADLDDGTVLVKVDYDTQEELKEQYGVTAQHTIVVLDSEGNAVTTDRGATTLEDVQSL